MFQMERSEVLKSCCKNQERIGNLKDNNDLNFNETEFPVKLVDIAKFEEINPGLPGIKVFGYVNKKIYPLRINKKDTKNSINLLLISENDNNHYCLIKHFSRLVSSQVNEHNEKKFILQCV